MTLTKSSIRLLLLVLACLVVAMVFILRERAGESGGSGAQGTSAGGAQRSTVASERPPRERAPRQRSSSGAPALSASEAVAALVGDTSLSDLDVIAGLRRIVDDAGRPLPERMEALEHVLNLIPSDKPELLREIASRPVMPDDVRMRLVSDALNRPARQQGEILVLLLANAAGDMRQAVKVELTGLCGEDVGDDVAAWNKAVEKLPLAP